MEVKKRIALVTGGTRGIGAEISKALLDAGYKVIANYNNNESIAEQFARSYKIPVMKWDISNFSECQKNISLIEEKYGNIEILVNNAAITNDVMFHKMSQEQWIDVIDTNLNSVFCTCRQVIKKMRDNKYGRIINISSVNALRGQLGQTNYTASKAAIIAFSKSLALENANKGITVNVIAPGYVNTEMMRAVPENALDKIVKSIPVNRAAEPTEIARAVIFLAAEEAAYITGSTISINGGLYMI